MRPCGQCQQPVSPDALTKGQCLACRSLIRVRREDPRLARILDTYPRLDRWRRWWLAEAHQVYIARTRSWTRRLLLVLDKETLEMKHALGAGITPGRWQPLSETQKKEWVGQAE